jgi:hypothetical protein
MRRLTVKGLPRQTASRESCGAFGPLENAENYVTKGEQYIGRLWEIIDVPFRSGFGPTDTEGLLRQVEAVHEMYDSRRDWLHVELKPTALIYRDPS